MARTTAGSGRAAGRRAAGVPGGVGRHAGAPAAAVKRGAGVVRRAQGKGPKVSETAEEEEEEEQQQQLVGVVTVAVSALPPRAGPPRSPRSAG